jgi:membrane protein
MWPLLKATYDAWDRDNAQRMGAALAYYTVFSLAPLLLIAIALAGHVFGHGPVHTMVLANVERTLGPESARTIRQFLLDASQATGARASAAGVCALLFGVMGIVAELQASLNQIWKIRPRSGSLGAFLRTQIVSLTFVLASGFLFLLSLILTALATRMGQNLGAVITIPEAVVHIVNMAATFGVTMLMFAAIYKLLPRASVAWRDVWTGAAATALLFVLGNFVLGIYIGKTSVASVHGAAGSLLGITVWTYYCAQIFYFGAELTHAYAGAATGRSN